MVGVGGSYFIGDFQRLPPITHVTVSGGQGRDYSTRLRDATDATSI